MIKLHVAVLLALTGIASSLFDTELHEKYKNMERSEFIEYFNKQDYSWKMSEEHHDESEYMACAHLDAIDTNIIPQKTHAPELFKGLPENFDAREKWPQCETIKEIYNQGDCGSCWTFGTANTASDRTCIHKDIHVHLSEEDFECLQTDVCNGGIPYMAFLYWAASGLVTQECKPYNIEQLRNNLCVKKCVDNKKYIEDKHTADKIYNVVNKTEDIKAELFHNGPIQAGFRVFEDFRKYEKGIYEHRFGELLGGHSVRIIGYGVEKGTEYWLVANSWGHGWGDNGLFKVKAFAEELHFENSLVTGVPKT